MHYRRNIKIFFLCMTLLMTTTGISMSADTLYDSLKNGTVGGEAKVWYQTNDSDANKHIFDSENSWFDAGIRLGYTTDPYKGVGIGVNFYAIDDLAAYENWANRSMMGKPHDESWAWLGEAYLTYSFRNTSAKVGRQNIGSPLVNSDTWPIFPNNFSAALMNNTDLSDTCLTAGFIWDERWRGTDEFEDFHDNLVMLGAVNKSITNTTLTAYVYFADDDYNTTADNDDTMALYFEANTKIAMLNLGAQYIRIDPDVKYSGGDRADETNALAAKISTTVKMVDLELAGSWVGDGYFEAAKLSDNRCKTPLYTRTISGDGDIAGRPKTKSAFLSVGIKPVDKLSLLARYGYYSLDDSKDYRKMDERNISDGDASAAELISKYTGFDHITLWGSLWYSNHEGCGAYNGLNDEDLITFRCWAKYEF